jgi:hypothetical protein
MTVGVTDGVSELLENVLGATEYPLRRRSLRKLGRFRDRTGILPFGLNLASADFDQVGMLAL